MVSAVQQTRIEGESHTGKEAVQLHQDLKIDVFALRRLAVAAAHMVTVQVDTCNGTHTISQSVKQSD